MPFRLLIIFYMFLSATTAVRAQVVSANPLSIMGNSGMIISPTTEIVADKELSIGTSYLNSLYLGSTGEPGSFYDQVTYVNLGFLPFIEGAVRLTHGDERIQLGDRSFFMRVRILTESDKLPAIAIGAHDPFGVNSLVNTTYLVASKNLNIGHINIKGTIGYGIGNIDNRETVRRTYLTGLWGSTTASYRGVTAMVEYDGDRVNTGVKTKLFDRVGINIALLEMKHFIGGLSAHFTL